MADDFSTQSWGSSQVNSDDSANTQTTDTKSSDFEFGAGSDGLADAPVSAPISEKSDDNSIVAAADLIKMHENDAKPTSSVAAADDDDGDNLADLESKIKLAKGDLEDSIKELQDKLTKADAMLAKITKVRDDERSLAKEVQEVLSV
ncbi:MAG: hypothetical protein WC227_01160 [Patescibacteria group bacterium]|jgi:hypothetical protein